MRKRSMAVGAVAACAGLAVFGSAQGAPSTPSATAAALKMTPGDVATVQRFAGSAVTGPVRFRVVKMTAASALQAVSPGERPLGDQTERVARHVVLVATATGPGLASLPMSAPPGFDADATPQPIAIMLLIDATEGTQLGGTYVYRQADLGQVDLAKITARVASSPVTLVEVKPTGG